MFGSIVYGSIILIKNAMQGLEDCFQKLLKL